MKAKPLLGHAGIDCGLFWVSKAGTLALTINCMRSCFLWNEGHWSGKFRYLPSDRIHGLALHWLVPVFKGRQPSPVLSVLSSSFVWVGYFKFIIACVLHFIGTGNVVIGCRELRCPGLIISQRGASAKQSDRSKMHSNPADNSHKASLPVCASYLLRHQHIMHPFTPLQYQCCDRSPFALA